MINLSRDSRRPLFVVSGQPARVVAFDGYKEYFEPTYDHDNKPLAESKVVSTHIILHTAGGSAIYVLNPTMIFKARPSGRLLVEVEGVACA